MSYEFERGQTKYFLRFSDIQGKWELYSKRKNMSTMGQVRFFKTLDDIEDAVKSLKGIKQLIEAEFSLMVA